MQRFLGRYGQGPKAPITSQVNINWRRVDIYGAIALWSCYVVIVLLPKDTHMQHSQLDEFSSLVLQIYRASAEVSAQEFQDAALNILKPLLPFDTSMWGIATHIPGQGIDIHAIHLHNTPLDMICDYAPLKHMDSCADAVAGQARVTLGFHSATQFADKRVREYREFLRRYGHENLFISTQADPDTQVVQWVTLFRADADQHCRPEELRLLAQLSPHLMQGMRLSLVHQLDRASFLPGDASMAAAIADQQGVIHYTTATCTQMLRAEFGADARGRLPSALLAWIAQSSGPYVGKTCVAMHRVHKDLVYMRLRPVCPADRLAPRQREVARLMTQGLSHKQAAQQLGVSPATVRNHITDIYRRLGVQNVLELAQALNAAPE